MTQLRLGVLGAGGRGREFSEFISRIPGLRIEAACDSHADRLVRAAAELGARTSYTDFDEMLTRSDIDAVVVATPMPLHAAHAIAALESGRHVLCEAPAALSLAQAEELVRVVRGTGLTYMLAENHLFDEVNLLVGRLVEQGNFGEIYYGAGEYVQDSRVAIGAAPWRRHWLGGLPGISNPAHTLGPLLDWMPSDRVATITGADSGSHHHDARGEPYHHDCAAVLARTEAGRLVSLRSDLISARPSAGNFQLQGTQGAFESSRAPGDPGRIWCRSFGREPKWFAPSELLGQGRRSHHLPAWYLDALAASGAPQLAIGGGSVPNSRCGADYFTMLAFIRAVQGELPNFVDVDRAMDMTLPGLVSQDPEAARRWVAVPDSRDWQPQLHVIS